MDWIKKNYDRFTLLLLAAALLGSSIFLFCAARGFSARFATLLEPVKEGNSVDILETKALRDAEVSLAKPAAWNAHSGSLFVSRKYVAKRDGAGDVGALIDPFEANSPALHPPIANSWFLEHGLENQILDGDVLDQDPDKDGFTVLDEYQGKTDPQDPASHPGYLTKLRLKRFIKVPFRLKFEAYDDDGSFQINTVDVRQPTQFVKQGDAIAGTKYKVVKFEKKFIPNPRTGVETDVSELTVQHVETGVSVKLVVRTEVDSPDQYAQFAFLWDHSEFSVKKDQKFVLKPEPTIEYKLIDIRDSEAVIVNAKTGDQIKVPRLD
ncbi:MAG: hypothetical protein PHQ12_07310 [Chthoniobacteraceae bacterium]|nr:hypothetical protein [Chthoniobacteraceae bacterium]